MPRKKDAVFFACSVEKSPPSWSNVSDNEVATWFENLLKRRWRVLSGKSTQARPIADKITEAVDASKAIVALFTGKHSVKSTNKSYVASSWVLCESAFALGRFRYSPHIVAGFREKGVDLDSLALLTIGGMEFPEFEREHLDRDKEKFQGYLNDLEQRIKSGQSGQLSFPMAIKLPFAQVELHKIYLIYRNGYGTVHNITQIAIKNPEQFMQEYEGKIKHHIWTHRQNFPALDEMRKAPIHDRKQAPFFHAILDFYRNRTLQIPLSVDEIKHRGNDIQFSVSFLDSNGQQLKLKTNDTIRYQYAWGLPSMFETTEEQLEPVKGSDIDPASYCLAELQANLGPIDRMQLELRFERETRGGERRELFSTSPFVRVGRGFSPHVDWTQPTSLPLIKGEPEEYNMWYEIYRLEMHKFDSRLKVAWRPSEEQDQM